MKKVFLIFSLMFSMNLLANEILVEVPGMVCQMCVQGMKKNFKSAVKSTKTDVKVDLDKKTVWVKLKEKISEDEIKKRVKGAGYNAKKITWLKKNK